MNDDTGSESLTTVHELVIDRKFAAPPEKVFAAWTDPALFTAWFGPQGLQVSELEMDVQVNGSWRATMLNADGTPHIIGGIYLNIEPPRRLSFTWAWQADGVPSNESLVEIEFEAAPGGTMMHFRHSGFESANAAFLHNEGWTSTFVCFDKFLETNTPG